MIEMVTGRGKMRSWSAGTIAAGRAVIDGRKRGFRALLPFAGPAIIASVAYTDPGNFATNIEAGSTHGYRLLWVVVLANATAMLFQALSAKLGIVTDKSLAQQCRDNFPRPIVYAMWIASEIAAMATDLAELLGAAIGLSLLSGMPLLASLALSSIITYVVLTIQRAGFRPLELTISALVTVIGICYIVELWIAPPDWALVAFHSVVPQFDGPESVTLAVGIVGATVMPHAIYLHSSLTQDRMPVSNAGDRKRILWFSNTEVLIALGIAGLINMAMIAMAATVFHNTNHGDVVEIETAYRTLTPLLGAGAATVFMISLLASGLSSSIVGTMAGQSIMQDFVRLRVPLWLRRVLTMAPSFAVIAMGFNATQALIISQVVLSLVVPIPIIALMLLTNRRDVMGEFVNGRATNILAFSAAALIIVLNLLLLLQIAHISVPLLPLA
jgi:manganese transport protein